MKRFIVTQVRILKTGLKNFARNSWLTTAATAIMVVTLSIIIGTFVANFTFNETIKNITDKIVVSVYLTDTISDDQRRAFEEAFRDLDNVESVEHITKEEALAAYKEENENDLDLLNAISQTDNPLPASLQIKSEDPNKMSDVTAIIEQQEFANLQSEPPSYSGERKAAIDRIISVANFFKISGIIASGVFAVISILIIFNTIRMTIFNRRDEIEIMKLIGATRSYIRGPFLVEAGLYGLIASAVTLTFFSILFVGQAENLASYIPEILVTKDFYTDNIILICVGVVAIGVLIGICSAYFATRRYLRIYSHGKKLKQPYKT